MPQNDLVTEIEEAENDVLYVAETCHKESVCWNKLKHIELTLQRAREALRWIPVAERLPERDGYYLVTYKSNAGTEIDYFEKARADRSGGFDCNLDNPVIAWMECPQAYTPPKEVEK